MLESIPWSGDAGRPITGQEKCECESGWVNASQGWGGGKEPGYCWHQHLTFTSPALLSLTPSPPPGNRDHIISDQWFILIFQFYLLTTANPSNSSQWTPSRRRCRPWSLRRTTPWTELMLVNSRPRMLTSELRGWVLLRVKNLNLDYPWQQSHTTPTNHFYFYVSALQPQLSPTLSH